MKKIFHIIFKTSEEDFISKGINIEGWGPLDALMKFHDSHSDTTFIAIYDLEAIHSLVLSRPENKEF